MPPMLHNFVDDASRCCCSNFLPLFMMLRAAAAVFFTALVSLVSRNRIVEKSLLFYNIFIRAAVHNLYSN